ncbi:MAG: hypothetical protein LBG06_09795 [Deltaproteobacteria bacterium]|nr:hypothetical protein [Deltaproteobacteria bacterium]
MHGGRRNVFNVDQFNNLILSLSFRDAVAEGQFPPRVSPSLSRGLGNPYHQFYPPFSHAVPAALGILAGNVLTGYALAAVLFTALGFVGAWRLYRLLTLSGVAACLGAFLFTLSPYLLLDRVSRTAWAEFAAFNLSPLALYLLLRWSCAGGIGRFLASSAALAALFATHLLTSFFLALFLAVFGALWALNLLSARGKGRRCWPRKLEGRAARALAAGAFAALMAAAYLGPAALYGDLIMKELMLPRNGFESTAVPVLALLSPSDERMIMTQGILSLRIQLGAPLLLSFLACAWSALRARPPLRRPPHLAPLIVTALLALALVTAPGPMASLFPPVQAAQASFRYVMIFVLAASLMGAMTLGALFQGGAAQAAARKGAALALALSAAVLAGPYLHQQELTPGYPFPVTETLLRDLGVLTYGNDAYFRTPPGPESGEWAPPGLEPVPGRGGAARRLFTADLSRVHRLPDGGVPLDVLYYPGLQEIKVSVDGSGALFRPETVWQMREGLGFLAGSSFGALDGPGPGALHGLVLTGLPDRGLLEAEVRFTGMGWANRVSAAALSVFALLCLAALFGKTGPLRARGPYGLTGT